MANSEINQSKTSGIPAKGGKVTATILEDCGARYALGWTFQMATVQLESGETHKVSMASEPFAAGMRIEAIIGDSLFDNEGMLMAISGGTASPMPLLTKVQQAPTP